MKTKVLIILAVIALSFSFSSCSEENIDPLNTGQTANDSADAVADNDFED